MPSTARSPSPRGVLAGAVLAAGVLDGLVGELFPLLFRPLGIVAGRFLLDALLTAVVALAPMAFVFAACRRAPIPALRARTVAGLSLGAGIAGRYGGAVVGSLLLGERVPSPLVLVTRSDLAVGPDAPVLLFVVLLGTVAAGLWPMVGAFGGVGLARLTGKSTGPIP